MQFNTPKGNLMNLFDYQELVFDELAKNIISKTGEHSEEIAEKIGLIKNELLDGLGDSRSAAKIMRASLEGIDCFWRNETKAGKKPPPAQTFFVADDFISKVTITAYARHRRSQIFDKSEAGDFFRRTRPNIRFHAQVAGFGPIPRACKKFDQKILPRDEAERIFPLIPCGNPDCRCHLSAER